MAYVQIDPVTCDEVVELFLSKTIFALLVNEWGRNVRRDEKIRDAVCAILNKLLASGAPVYLAQRVHGRTFFVVLPENERGSIRPRMFQEIMTGYDASEWICFDRNELFQAMPQLQKEYPEPNISGDPWFRVMKHLDNLDFEKIFPESAGPFGDNGEWATDEQTSKRIAELETALAAKDAELEQARAEMSTLREELAALEEARQGAASPEGHGLCSLVIMMRREGKTEEEIAAFLSNDGKWCSAAQIGALLYLKEGRVSKDAMQKHGQRLLGTA